MGDKDNYKLIANNKKAYFDYFIEDTWEAGIALHGTEVKSVRMGKCSIKEAFIRVRMERCLSTTCTSVLMRRATFLTRIRSALRSFFFTDMRSTRFWVR